MRSSSVEWFYFIFVPCTIVFYFMVDITICHIVMETIYEEPKVNIPHRSTKAAGLSYSSANLHKMSFNDIEKGKKVSALKISTTNIDSSPHKEAHRHTHRHNDDLNNYIKHGPSVSTINRNSTFPLPLHEIPTFLDGYITWHEKGMVCLRNPSCFPSNRSSLRLLVWQCPAGSLKRCEGLGDRMRGIVSSLAIAMMTGRMFLLMWPDNPYPFLHAVAPGAIDWRVPTHLLKAIREYPIINSGKFTLAMWEKCPAGYQCIHNAKWQQDILPKTMFSDDDETYQILSGDDIKNVVMWSRWAHSKELYGRKEWKRHRKDKVFEPYDVLIDRVLLRTLFRPSIITRRIMAHFIPALAQQKGYVSIHARTGQDVGESFTSRFHLMRKATPRTLAERFMECVVRAGIPRDMHVVFVSDSLPLKISFASLAKKYGRNATFSRIRAMHVAHKHHGGGRKHYFRLFTDYKWTMFINTFAEFFAISNGTMIIASTSEFSRLAYLLSNVTVEGYKIFNASLKHPNC